MGADHGPGPGGARPVVLLAGAACALFLLEALRPAVGSDMRYVEACWEMQSGHDWLIPHLAFVPYFEKPILLYWLGAACQRLFGESGPATQLPSVLCSVVSLLVTYAWAHSLRGPRFALAAAALLLGSGLFFAMGSILTTDPLLALCVTTAFYCSWRHEQGAGGRWIWCFWVSAALGALAKGPLAWVLIGCGIAPYLAVSRPLAQLPRAVWAMRPLSGLAVLLAVNVPWWWAVWRVDPRFVEFFFIRINLHGLTNANINHPGPPWYYVATLAMALAPFTLLAAWPLLARMARIGREAWVDLRSRWQGAGSVPDAARRGDLYLLCTALVPFLFLSASASKLQTYLLPLMPSFILLTAQGLAALVGAVPRWMGRVVLIELGLVVVGLAGLAVAVVHLGLGAMLTPGAHLLVAAAGLALAASLVVAYRALARRQLVHALVALGLGTALAALACGPVILEVRLRSNATLLARYVRSALHDGDELVICSALAQNYEIVNTLHRRCAYAGPVRELGMGHFTEATAHGQALPERPDEIGGALLPDDPWLLSEEHLEAQWPGPRRIWLFADLGIMQRLRTAHCHVILVAQTRKALLVSNQPGPDPGPGLAPAPDGATAGPSPRL